MAEMIKSNKFVAAISQVLDDYAVDVQKAVGSAVKKTGKKALKVVREKAPVQSGEYKKNWRATEIQGGVFGSQTSVVIHNKKDYRLVHLLENGHQKSNGGRVEGIPHVRPAYEEAERTLPELTAQAIEEAGNRGV